MADGGDFDALATMLKRLAVPFSMQEEPAGLFIEIGALVVAGEAMARTALDLLRVAGADAVNVLLVGETGTGKELFAKLLHNASTRADGPFLGLNLREIPEPLVASELFGARRGAFTGAAEAAGVLKAAAGGTVLLDEVDSAPLGIQVALLRVLQERAVRAVGAPRPEALDVRIVAGVQADVAEKLASGRLREDLYFRLRGKVVVLPPLRTCPDEVPVLAARLVSRHSAALHRREFHLHADSTADLLRHSWPGNRRELDSVLLAAVAEAGAEADYCRPTLDALRVVERARCASAPIADRPSKTSNEGFWCGTWRRSRTVTGVAAATGWSRREVCRALDRLVAVGHVLPGYRGTPVSVDAACPACAASERSAGP